MKKSVTYLLLFLLSGNVFTQVDVFKYYKTLYVADSLANSGNLDSAIIVYENAFKQVKYIHNTILFKVIDLSKQLNDKNRLKTYKKLYASQRKCPRQNMFLKKKVDSLLAEDQKFMRNKEFNTAYAFLKKCETTHCADTEEYKKQKQIFKAHIEQMEKRIHYLLSLFDKYGYLGEEKIGEKRAYAVVVMLYHYEMSDNYMIVEPYLKKALLNNEITPYHYTVIIDRYLQFHTGKQRYWTWADVSDIPPKKFSKTEKAEILKKRNSIGLFGSDFNCEYKENYWRIHNSYIFGL